MGGIAGLLLPAAEVSADALAARAARMAAALVHRGPAGEGAWADPAAGVALAARRLAHESAPAVHADARHVLVLDGNVYNLAALARELAQGGHAAPVSDAAAVLLAAVQAWGLEAALARCNGQFALALWDRQERCLHLARDHVGLKPLYYGWAGTSFVFGSELKALWREPAFDNGVDPGALALLLRLDYIPAPHAIHERCWKLRAGHLLRLDAAAVAAGATAHDPERAQCAFWSARERCRAALAAPFRGDLAAAEDALDATLRQAVAARQPSAARFGAFLSGGIDSSLVTALMQAESPRPVRSFSIGFAGSHHDEAPLARELAQHLGTEHVELYVDGADALAVVPELPRLFDEPFADASQVPTALLARLAGAQIDVALAGDGGDELFGGYRRYRRALRNWRALRILPRPLRAMFAAHPPGEAARLGGLAALRAELGARDAAAVYRQRIVRWREPLAVVPGARALSCGYDLADPAGPDATPADAMMLADFVTGLPDAGLCKVDRATMAAGLEARLPLLDPAVVELAWSLPLAMKLRGNRSKLLPKRVLARYVPAAMVQRPKRGFGAPVRTWLAGELRPWAEALLAPERLTVEGHFDAAAITAVWQAFCAGEQKWHTHLWSVLMFQAWLDDWQAQHGEAGR